LGALQALGLRTLDDTGQPLERITPALWPRLAGFAGSFAAVARGKGGFPQIRVACDVSNPLHGKDGAAAVYGPQKGLKKEEVGDFDARAATVSRGLLEFFGQPLSLRDEPGAGAAGGLGFGLRAAFGAELVPGFELVSAWIGLEEKISAVDCVLTGEGKFDVSSLAGKGPFAVIQAAHQLDKGVCVFAGVVTPEARSRLEEDFGARAVSIEHPEEDLETNLREGRRNLTEALKRFKGTEPGG
jgi:glycerate kinase